MSYKANKIIECKRQNLLTTYKSNYMLNRVMGLCNGIPLSIYSISLRANLLY